ncbi:uncharacterized protein CANTADRAFT_205706 [Suhomyces tanzawaensis NRRL Y-17324]|uniref:Vacuolar membrane protein n=1 Tax=Suhomyces tanzawaensis NRRL Y-17324 TaxID=984487 RepID=A0A1E4SJE7_9ASCO|nr:uncharacterized protein CANTADRAFT_205706 [Suhomyces tanzawaensis NRRL Y-17324]ODV79624.1 hypothetical protein CANTADRAFT_205706 [Suhomyces tanzawaensis NRRL Y-17324]
MPIRLDDEAGASGHYVHEQQHHPVIRLINALRIHNVPAINYLIISVLGFFLLKLTTRYTGLYMKSSLITIIITNLVLYGISETLAQTLISYRGDQPRISFKINEGYSRYMSFNSNDIFGTTDLNSLEAYRDEENEEQAVGDEPIDDAGIERFIDYVEEDQNAPLQEEDLVTTPIVELTFFKFNRLAGFMCWGFILAFVQCWWYKFLQIYSKDPKFIEVLRKVLTDQLCYSPVSLFLFFTYGTMVLDSGTWEDTKSKLSKIYLKTLIINYSVWFPVQFFNFLIVPRNFQVPFSSSVSVLWNCFLSMRNSSS